MQVRQLQEGYMIKECQYDRPQKIATAMTGVDNETAEPYHDRISLIFV